MYGFPCKLYCVASLCTCSFLITGEYVPMCYILELYFFILNLKVITLYICMEWYCYCSDNMCPMIPLHLRPFLFLAAVDQFVLFFLHVPPTLYSVVGHFCWHDQSLLPNLATSTPFLLYKLSLCAVPLLLFG
jgi:hypothetical protein